MSLYITVLWVTLSIHNKNKEQFNIVCIALGQCVKLKIYKVTFSEVFK